ncbi:MAG: hypothetical protein DMG01_24035 [Acidobacteria bacterium]|nr:MAG: hypothetical protein DMG01_24035 [Acidobacteriota bacterium]
MARTARRAPRQREPLRVARPCGVSRKPLRRRFGARPLRSAGVGVHADGPQRARALPPGVVRPAWRARHEEDFDLAIDAVAWLEERIRGWEATGRRRFPDLVILVTGDGVRRAEFERRFAGLPARRVQLRARWLEPEDYPRVVGSADLGLCLHRSSSGLDIPMKVADLFGAGVPVCALDYGACLAERVRHGDNGLLFSTARQLADVIFDLFEAFPGNQSSLDRLRTGARRSARPTWEEGWSRDAKPVLLPDGQPPTS